MKIRLKNTKILDDIIEIRLGLKSTSHPKTFGASKPISTKLNL
jgi:hypothetical protein